MTFRQAVKVLGGPRSVARQTGIAHSVIIYWMKYGVSRFRKPDEQRIIALAKQQQKAA